MWQPQVEALGAHARVVRFDHRGHGASPVPPGPYTVDDLGQDVLALLDHLGVERAHYVGLSLGAMVGMWLAARASERIDRLALLCCGPYLPPVAGWFERAAAVRAGGIAAVADPVFARWFTADFAGAEPYRRMLLATPVEGYAGCCEAIGAMDLRPLLGQIHAATLVIAGAADPAAPPEMGAHIAATVRSGRLVVVPGAAHLANVEQPGIVNQHLVEHLFSEGGGVSVP
jgi:3-oxoadipate enol-lactonase